MYSVMLMVALSGGADTVGAHRNGGCNGNNGHGGNGGCNGVLVAHGCNGGNGHGCHGGNGYGNGHGCHGGYGYQNGHGFGGGCSGSVILPGGGYPGGGCSGSVILPGAGHGPGPAHGVTPEQPKVMPKIEGKAEIKKTVQSSAPATIIVSLPAGARLTVDGVATTSTSEVRTLITPPLEVGADYVYTLRAEVDSISQTRQVTVRGGATTRAAFTFSNSGVASR